MMTVKRNTTKELKCKIYIDITSYRGIAINAKHYYGTIKVRELPEHTTKVYSKLVRPITQAEIDSDPEDRFYYYHEGDETECFNTWQDVVKAGNDRIIELGLSLKDAIVEGIPNNESMPLEKALSGEVDTTLRCTKCGKPIHGACYNYPSGVMCLKCAEERHKQ